MFLFLNLESVFGMILKLNVLLGLFCPRSCLKAVACGSGGKVDNTSVANRELILKCFVRSTNTSKANSVETTVLTITKILLIHPGNKGLGGVLSSATFFVGILLPFLSIFSINASKSVG